MEAKRWPLVAERLSQAQGAARARERRKNLIALAIVGVLLLLVGLFCWRPAPLVGVSADAVASSLHSATSADGKHSWDHERCRQVGDGVFSCTQEDISISGGGNQRTVRVETSATGCWTATARGSQSAQGCITILDL